MLKSTSNLFLIGYALQLFVSNSPLTLAYWPYTPFISFFCTILTWWPNCMWKLLQILHFNHWIYSSKLYYIRSCYIKCECIAFHNSTSPDLFPLKNRKLIKQSFVSNKIKQRSGSIGFIQCCNNALSVIFLLTFNFVLFSEFQCIFFSWSTLTILVGFYVYENLVSGKHTCFKTGELVESVLHHSYNVYHHVRSKVCFHKYNVLIQTAVKCP